MLIRRRKQENLPILCADIRNALYTKNAKELRDSLSQLHSRNEIGDFACDTPQYDDVTMLCLVMT